MNKLTSSLKTFFKFIWKNVLKYVIIVGGILIVVKLILDALSPKTSVEIEEAEQKIEEIRERIDKIEAEKEEIRIEHEKILHKKKDRDKAAGKYFPGI